MGQVWSSADFDGTNEAGHQGGRGSPLAVTAHNPSLNAPLNRRPIDVSIDFSTDDSCSNALDRVQNFHSVHTNGANFLMGDGGVRFVNDNINPAVYQALSTINGGEVTSGF